MRRLIDLIIARTPMQYYDNGNLICVLVGIYYLVMVFHSILQKKHNMAFDATI